MRGFGKAEQASSLFTVARQTGWKPVLLCLLLVGCSEEAAKQTTTSEPVLIKQYRQNSATVIVSLSETNITTSGKIQLLIDTHVPPGEEVVFPDAGYFVEPFTVADGYSEPVQTLPNGKQLHRRVWILIPSLPGKVVFQPMEIMAGANTITTEPVAVEVTSLLPQGLAAYEIKDIAETVDLMPEEKKSREFGLLLTGLGISILLLIIIVKWIRRPKPEIILLPHETALLALDQLPENETERIQELNNILLRYIEGHFQLPTTARTLNEITPHLPKDHLLGRREPLEKILQESEQTRFSNRVPAGFADELESYVRSFITMMQEEPCD